MQKTPNKRQKHSALADRLRSEIEGEVLFGAADRGRYATDASIYQIMPIGVVVPKSEQDVEAILSIARDHDVPVIARGGGTSQSGQTVGHALIIDTSKHLNRVLDIDPGARRAMVQPGLVLDHLNAALRPHGLTFPVDISTGSRATIGGMTANNSCGTRSIRYGNMVHSVRAIDAILADGSAARFAELSVETPPSHYDALVQELTAIGKREREEIAHRFPKVLRRVGGYNLDTLPPMGTNMASILVGSEGTLAYFKRIELDLSVIPPYRFLGVCHFPTFYQAMDAAQHIVRLDPSAVELVDRTLIDLARSIPAFSGSIERFIQGQPDAVLLVEFAGDDEGAERGKLRDLAQLLADLGLPGAVLEAIDPSFQREIWEVRKAGLNIVMSMKGDGKPVSFIEDCAVPLADLAEYTRRLEEVFAKYGTRGTWYAHASVGTLHVRPILNLKLETGSRAMRAIAEEAFELIREYKGSHSGEHGDGLVRSEFHEAMFGPRLARAFEEVKSIFDPAGMMNPGKIVNPSKMDDRALFRFPPDYEPLPLDEAMDWSERGGFAGAVEMCNNNGACRKSNPGAMCPSYRATGDEQHVTRGRANTLRLAITGQLGPEAFTSDDMRATMDLCVGCKSCKRECPTGVDMARMKIEFQSHYIDRHGLSIKDRMIAYLPRYAARIARLRSVAGLRDIVPGLPKLMERTTGISARRRLPRFRRDAYLSVAPPRQSPSDRGEVVLFADTFNTWFEPENARAAQAVLEAAGYRVHLATPAGQRPLCCGRTFLSVGLVSEAKIEATRTADALRPFVQRGLPIIGLEPSCLLTMRDEFHDLLPSVDAKPLADHALLLTEFLAREADSPGADPIFEQPVERSALVHGHCHQKAFGAMPATLKALNLVPGLDASQLESGCCGMAGAFGYDANHYEISMKMAEISLAEGLKQADADTIIVADGTSCRTQIKDLSGKEAIHSARLFEKAL